MSNTSKARLTEDQLAELLAVGVGEVLRLVRFSDVEEWLAELRLQRDGLLIPWIRVTALFRWDLQVSIMQHVTACAGFWSQREYVELRAYCGQRMSGDDGEAVKRWDKIRDRIDEVCRELHMEIRGGYYANQGEGGRHA
jgi:hypothetical protein